MKKKGFIVLSLMILILISNILAYQSTITVKTGLPNKEIIFKACDQVTGKTLESGEFRQESDSQGKVVFDYNLEPILIKMSFMAWSGSNYLSFLNEKQTIFLNNVILDEFVDIDLNKKEPSFIAYSNESNEEVVQEGITAKVEVSEEAKANISSNLSTESNLTETTQTQEVMPETKEDTALTGAVIEGTKSVFNSKITYYIVGGIFILGVLVLVTFILRKKLEGKGTYINFRVKEGKTDGSISKQIHDKRLAAAERKLEEAKKELDYIKNRKSKLDEVRMRFEQDKKELERLERGG
ncbi:MAG: hypothetical protein PHH54_02795 [Candidatus Nanoarchaeia archaeon]|nr:hypothetical protein [Candidatus Nanoarchaeia archaeon]MDD5740888.1 hypothetical protein [Candidatus Nanoarchaeia archaeon]